MNRPEENRAEVNCVEDAIQQTLAGLRDAPVPEGLERRILHTLEDRSAVQTRPRRLANLAWGTAAACGLAGIVAAALFFNPVHTATHRPAKQEAPNGTLHPLDDSSKKLAAADASTAPGAASAESSNQVPHPRLRRVSAATQARTGVAESGRQPVNMPPPPLPLTRQERLLLEIAHRRPPFELAMLTSARREAQEQHDRNEFEQFFGPTEAELETERINNSQPSEQGKP